MLLVLGTHNRKKGLELIDLLTPWGFECKTLADFPTAIDVEETGSTFAENARLKACQQARHLGQWVLGEDSGLAVDALNGAPGVYSARFSGPSATDESNNRLLIEKLGELPTEKRTAHYVCHAVLADPRGKCACRKLRPMRRADSLRAGGQRRLWLRPVFRDRRVSPHIRRTWGTW